MTLKVVDLFAGMGGLRIGVNKALKKYGEDIECVLTSEIKPTAIKALNNNFKEEVSGDIHNIDTDDIPDFDMLLAGFPCQPFSSGGKRHGFLDTRGTLFFEIERILEAKKPEYFILENVEGLVTHDLEKKSDKVGRTLKTILSKLSKFGYKTSWRIIDSQSCGVAQSRKRIFIVGSLGKEVDLSKVGTRKRQVFLKDILKYGQDSIDSKFTKLLLENYDLEDLHGKSIKDKRGGDNNIHSWDFSLKGKTTKKQRKLLNLVFKERRRKKWAEEIGITWMDGMPLTAKQIKVFFDDPKLEDMLEDLKVKGYLKYEYPKKLYISKDGRKVREYDDSKEKGYNLVAGKLSYEIAKIMSPDDVSPTLVATDIDRLAVVDGKGLRKLTIKECLKLCGYPSGYNVSGLKIKEVYDLIGNTVVVNVVEEIATELLSADYTHSKNKKTMKGTRSDSRL
jgi:DNA (cytosine-5)-methyltransferase 1